MDSKIQEILNLLTDKLVGKIDLEGDKERFGSMLTISYIAEQVRKIEDK